MVMGLLGQEEKVERKPKGSDRTLLIANFVH